MRLIGPPVLPKKKAPVSRGFFFDRVASLN